MDQTLSLEVIAHHLRLFGALDASDGPTANQSSRLQIITVPSDGDTQRVEDFTATGGIVVALNPEMSFLSAFGVETAPSSCAPPIELRYIAHPPSAWSRLRSLHEITTFRHPRGVCVAETLYGEPVWLWLPFRGGGILFIGSELAGDLVRYRQGDPAKASARPTEARWGIAGERPNYLFEEQLEGEPPQERHADWWAMALARFLAQVLGNELIPILPGKAPGAMIITGDDDQAYLEKYAEQLDLLDQTPITYFLHPLTRHTPEALRKLRNKSGVDLGIHPDALNTPQRYQQVLAEQVKWYYSLTGERPSSLRNHGFLNDGYWCHLPAWLDEGIRISSNLPGLDGNILNGSLLPARLTYAGALSPHWSLLTAFGDGMVFALKMSDAESGERILELARRIRESGVPGIIVLNLHPQNIAETRAMHIAAIQVIQSGFLAWTMSDCLNWFSERDGGARLPRIEHANSIAL